MAVEIPTSSCRISLTGTDSKRFIREVLEPSTDPRRLEHLRCSDETFRRIYSPEPIHDLP
jgi:hypothetical protein